MSDANFLPQPLRVLAGRALERALNRALALDPETQAALRTLDGRCVDLSLLAPPVALSLRVEGTRLLVGPPSGGTAGLGIGATLGGLLSQLAPWRAQGGAPVGRVTMSGDAELARQLQRLAQRFDPDWDEALVPVFGEVAGHQFGKAVRRALLWGRDSAAALARDTAEWLTEESRDVVPAAELTVFLDEVDELRDRGERLEARIARLSARLRGGG